MQEAMRRDAGISLISILVSFALLGIGILGTTQAMQAINQKKTAVEWISARSSLKRLLLGGTSCAAIQRCTGNETLDIRSLEGRFLVKADRSMDYGPYNVEARCMPNKTVEFRIAAVRGQSFAKDPLSGKPLTWESPEGVLIRGGELCGTPQFGLGEERNKAPRVLVGKLCAAASGSCEIFPEAKASVSSGARMCCTDGRDARKPQCPAGTFEIAAYWDRDGDWGLEGRWVVTCQ